MGIRTPDLLHAISGRGVHRRVPAQVNVLERALPLGPVRAGCCTPLRYGPPGQTSITSQEAPAASISREMLRRSPVTTSTCRPAATRTTTVSTTSDVRARPAVPRRRAPSPRSRRVAAGRRPQRRPQRRPRRCARRLSAPESSRACLTSSSNIAALTSGGRPSLSQHGGLRRGSAGICPMPASAYSWVYTSRDGSFECGPTSRIVTASAEWNATTTRNWRARWTTQSRSSRPSPVSR
jgi:hypothetical protein